MQEIKVIVYTMVMYSVNNSHREPMSFHIYNLGLWPAGPKYFPLFQSMQTGSGTHSVGKGCSCAESEAAIV